MSIVIVVLEVATVVSYSAIPAHGPDKRLPVTTLCCSPTYTVWGVLICVTNPI